MKLNHVYCGESLSILKTFPSESIDCIVTSPPYFNLRDYKHIQQIGREKTPQEYISNLMSVFNECKRVLKKTGSCWVNIADSYKDKSLIGIPEMFALSMQDNGWIRRNSIIWFKNNCMPSSIKDRFTIDFEYFYFFTKEKKYYFETQYEPLSSHTLKEIEKEYTGKGVKDYKGNGVQNPSDIKRRIVYKLAPFGGKNKHKQYGNRTYSGNEYEITSDNLKRIKRCVWNINHQSFKGAHFAVFPEKLIETPIKACCPSEICVKCGKPKIIKYDIDRKFTRPANTSKYFDLDITHTNPVGSTKSILKRPEITLSNPKYISQCSCNVGFHSGIVLDPFAGSGTIALVSKKLKRNYIMIDINEEYCKMMEDRLKK